MLKIETVAARDFLGLGAVSLALPEGVSLVCGDNAAGKSSLQNAIRFALAGEVSRVKPGKRDVPQLIKTGADESFVEVTLTGRSHRATISAGGDMATYCDSTPAMRYALDPAAFMAGDEDSRRVLLLSLLDVAPTPDQFRELAARHGADSVKAADTAPHLIVGWDEAEKYAAGKAAEARKAWEAAAGEKYGSKKAEGYKATARAVVERWATKAEAHKAAVERTTKLELDLIELEKVAQDARIALALLKAEVKCPKCDCIVRVPGSRTKAEQALSSAERRLAEARVELADLRPIYDEAGKAAKEIADAEAVAEQTTNALAALHKSAAEWSAISGLCAPSGLPRDLVIDMVKKLNRTMRRSHPAWGDWLAPVELRDDMMLTVGGRIYPLLSESEKWVADACIAAAVSEVAKIGVVLLDRFDVLAPERRLSFVDWAKAQADAGNQVIAFGTLKSLPEIPGVMTFWLEGGACTASNDGTNKQENDK